jgi:hypothetical protein
VTEAEDFAGLEVTQGLFVVRYARLAVDLPDVKVWEVDCRSKHPLIESILFCQGWQEVAVIPAPEARFLAESGPWVTALRLPGDWESIIADAARYTIRICAYH